MTRHSVLLGPRGDCLFQRGESRGDRAILVPAAQPESTPERLVGFPAWRAGVEPSLEIFRFRLSLGVVHPGLDPDQLVAEYTSDGIAVPTGKLYRNVYIGVFCFREGRIRGLREFYNPAVAAESLRSD